MLVRVSDGFVRFDVSLDCSAPEQRSDGADAVKIVAGLSDG